MVFLKKGLNTYQSLSNFHSFIHFYNSEGIEIFTLLFLQKITSKGAEK